jgi:hypothetical protein
MIFSAVLDERLRKDLESKHGSKTWEIEAAILAEASKQLQERGSISTPNHDLSLSRTIQKDQSNKSLEIDIS